ncbi:MAG TPA: Flp family type IVb pilin [Nitrospirales bacterium]
MVELAPVNSFRRDEGGATVVEYGLIVALAALVLAVSSPVIGPGHRFVAEKSAARAGPLCPRLDRDGDMRGSRLCVTLEQDRQSSAPHQLSQTIIGAQ